MCIITQLWFLYKCFVCIFSERNEINNQLKFVERQIAEWEAKQKEASENADLKAFEFAERELANYREMLKRYAV